jgi:hypothetical protein
MLRNTQQVEAEAVLREYRKSADKGGQDGHGGSRNVRAAGRSHGCRLGGAPGGCAVLTAIGLDIRDLYDV